MKRIAIILALFAVTLTACRSGAEAGTIPTTTTTTIPETTTTTSTTSTTTTTTLPPTTTTTVAEPEISCSAESSSQFERRYSFDSRDGLKRPAPTGVLWEENITFSDETGSRSVVVSGVLTKITTEPYTVTQTWQTEAIILDFCAEQPDGTWVTGRFVLTIEENLDWSGLQWKAINIADLDQIGDILPFGYSSTVNGGVVGTIACETCELAPRQVLDQLVVGRQYVVEIIVHSELLGLEGQEDKEESYQRILSNNRSIIACITGEGPEPAEGTIGTFENATWFSPWGEI